MNGAKLASEMRQAHPGTPVLIVTGYAAGELAGGVPGLAKPFRQGGLAAALDGAVYGCAA